MLWGPLLMRLGGIMAQELCNEEPLSKNMIDMYKKETPCPSPNKIGPKGHVLFHLQINYTLS
eukprot:1158873-Pelagomonas_calceolata.AAC.6